MLWFVAVGALLLVVVISASLVPWRGRFLGRDRPSLDRSSPERARREDGRTPLDDVVDRLLADFATAHDSDLCSAHVVDVLRGTEDAVVQDRFDQLVRDTSVRLLKRDSRRLDLELYVRGAGDTATKLLSEVVWDNLPDETRDYFLRSQDSIVVLPWHPPWRHPDA